MQVEEKKVKAKNIKPAEKPQTKPIAPERAARMLEMLPGWFLRNDGKAIFRQFEFSDYMQAFTLAVLVSELAEERNHHPDIRFGYGYARIEFTTHNIGGLHMNDFIMAKAVNELENK